MTPFVLAKRHWIRTQTGNEKDDEKEQQYQQNESLTFLFIENPFFLCLSVLYVFFLFKILWIVRYGIKMVCDFNFFISTFFTLNQETTGENRIWFLKNPIRTAGKLLIFLPTIRIF